MADRFEVGRTVWIAYAASVQTPRPCRACAGAKVVTLILGSGEHVQLDCRACAMGYERPTGTEMHWAYESRPSSFYITGIEVVQDETGERVRYRSGSEGAYSSIEHERCFATHDEALAAGAVLVAEHEAEKEARIAWKVQDTNKSYAWNAAYHLRQAKKDRESAEHHERKAVVLKAKSKAPSEVDAAERAG